MEESDLKDTNRDVWYPFYGKSKGIEGVVVVCFSNWGVGTVVEGKTPLRKLGDTSHTWDMSQFTYLPDYKEGTKINQCDECWGTYGTHQAGCSKDPKNTAKAKEYLLLCTECEHPQMHVNNCADNHADHCSKHPDNKRGEPQVFCGECGSKHFGHARTCSHYRPQSYRHVSEIGREAAEKQLPLSYPGELRSKRNHDELRKADILNAIRNESKLIPVEWLLELRDLTEHDEFTSKLTDALRGKF